MVDSSIGPAKRPLATLRVPPVSSRPSVASTIQRQLDENTGKVTLSRDEATETVLTLAECSDNEAKLAQVSAEARRYELFALVGDYAGRVVDRVYKATANKKDLPTPVSKLRDGLAEEFSSMPHGGGGLRGALEEAVKNLSSDGLAVDLDMVKLAINTYSDRNKVFHSELGSKEVADDMGRVHHTVDGDLERLPWVLPDDQIEHFDLWRKILDFYPPSQQKSFDEDARRKLQENLPTT